MIQTQKTTTTVPTNTSLTKISVVVTSMLIIVLCTILLCINGYRYFHYSGRYLTIEMKTSVTGNIQVFFDTGRGYNENESYTFKIRSTPIFEKYVFPFPDNKKVFILRFDPLDREGPFEIKSLTVETRDDIIIWQGEKLAQLVVPLQQMHVIKTQPFLTGLSTGHDPFFHVAELTIPSNRHTHTRTFLSIVVFTAVIAIMGFILFLMIDSLIRSDRLYPRKKSSILLFLQNTAAGILVLAIIGLYLWTATSNYKPFHFSISGVYDDAETLYVDLAEALLQGRLSLLIEPPPELISLPDPYDPLQNSGLRLHDASLYKGHYYLYFGPAPALTAFIPWKLLTGKPMPHNLAGAIFAVGGFIISVLLMILIVRGTGLKSSFQTILIGIMMLGMCNMVLPVLRRPFMYEVTSLSAYFWSMLSLFFIFSFLLFEKRRITYLFVSSLCYGLAIASRFSYVYGVLIFLIPLWCNLDYQSKITRDSLKRVTVSLLAVGTPLAEIVGILLLYNYFRFGNLLEFGLRYQLGILRPLDYPFLSIQNFWINNYLHLMSGIFINGSFPFFHVLQSVKIPENITVPFYYPLFSVQAEPAAGILANLPFLWIIIPAWLYLKLLTKCVFPKAIKYFAFLLLLCAIPNWIVVSLFSYAHMRYVIDFLPMFLLFSCLVYFMIYDHFRESVVKRSVVQCIAFITVVYAALANIGISIEVYGQMFQKGNPELYKTIEHAFNSIPQIISYMK